MSSPQQSHEEHRRVPYQTHLILSKEETNSNKVHYDIAGPKMEHLSLDCWRQLTLCVWTLNAPYRHQQVHLASRS